MALILRTCCIQAVERLAPEFDEVLACMPRSEATGTGMLSWPAVTLPRTVVGFSDFGCGELWDDATVAEVLAAHPREIPPSREHVDAILTFGRRVIDAGRTRDHRVLAHCAAGVSRSVAAALLIFALEDGPGRETDSLGRLRQASRNDDPTPNRNLLLIGDAALGRRGRLYGIAIGEKA